MKLRVTENCKFLRLYEATEDELEQVKYTLKKRIRGHFYNPLVKKKLWDGYISFYKDGYIPIGLWNEMFKLGETFNYEVHIEGLDKIIDVNFDEQDFRDWAEAHFADHPKYKARDYQVDAAISILKNRLTTSEIATSSGKTLITFLVYGYLKCKGRVNRMLVIVPNTTLVMQLNDDFDDYNNGKLDLKVRMVYGGSKDNDPEATLIVGTFHSLTRKHIDYFKGIDVICVDECLHPNSLVRMEDGSHKKISDVQIGDKVETVNQTNGEVQIRSVDHVYENLSDEDMYEIETEDGRILRLTGNHKVLLQDLSWKRVDKLTKNDELFDINKKNSSYYDEI